VASDSRITTGQLEFSQGIDSSKVPLIQSQANPNGLPRNMLSWLTNGSCRGGGVTPRGGFEPLVKVAPASAGLYQGGFLYDQSSLGAGGHPYLMLSIGGRMIQVRVDTDNSVNDVTGAFADPATVAKAYFVQGVQFLVKQAGDGQTLPLFWDGATLRRSVGIGGSPTSELPAATAMAYYQGQFWYAQNNSYCAGDVIFDSSSGTAPYEFADSILKVTENPVAFGGDGFAIPAGAGNITGFGIPISLDMTLGQGPIFIFTSKQIYALTVPTTRADWIAATSTNQPLQVMVMNGQGATSDRSIVAVNGDLFFQTLVPGIMSFFMALRYFETWGNSPISNNINRVMQFNNRALMNVATGSSFNNRLLQGILPVQTPVGIGYQALAVLDTDPVSTLQNQNDPAWDGMYEGLDFLQLFEGDYGGLQRAFAVVHSRLDDSIEVWELSLADIADRANTTDPERITMWLETPAFDWSEFPRAAGGGPFACKRLDGIDAWFDQVLGTVLITIQFRPDQNSCWYDWGTTEICSAENTCADVVNPQCYPTQPNNPGYRMPICFGPPTNPDCQPGNKRPVTVGYSFQVKITVKGYCRLRGFHLHAVPFQTAPFYHMIKC
jgi:hypothetical protein